MTASSRHLADRRCRFAVIKKQKLDVPALYDPHGRYRFVGGVNWRAAVALLISIAPNLYASLPTPGGITHP